MSEEKKESKEEENASIEILNHLINRFDKKSIIKKTLKPLYNLTRILYTRGQSFEDQKPTRMTLDYKLEPNSNTEV